MIYNMLTLSIQLLLIGTFVGVMAYAFVPQGRSQLFVVELILSILGAFLGTVFEVFIRTIWNLPMVFHLVYQFLVPLVVAVLTLAIFRLTNSFRE